MLRPEQLFSPNVRCSIGSKGAVRFRSQPMQRWSGRGGDWKDWYPVWTVKNSFATRLKEPLRIRSRSVYNLRNDCLRAVVIEFSKRFTEPHDETAKAGKGLFSGSGTRRSRALDAERQGMPGAG